jgi:hypothetical protein
MAQLAAANVTYSLVDGSRIANPCDPRFSAVFNVSFGDGTATYTSGGLPLTKAKLGCPAIIQELYIMSPGVNGITFAWNRTAETIQVYQHLHNFIMAGGVTTTADFLYHSSGALGKAAATNVTMSGTAPATTGGVVAALNAAEMATSTIVPATTLQVRVVGW